MSYINPTATLADLGGGRYQNTIAVKPIAYLTGGSYAPIDPTWTDGDATYPHVVTAAKLRVRGNNEALRRFLPVPGDDGKWLEIGAPYVQVGGTWTQVSLGTPTRSANLMTWTRPQSITKLYHAGHYCKIEIELLGGFVPENNLMAFPVGISGLTRSGLNILDGAAVVATLRPFVAFDAANPDDVRPIANAFVTIGGNPYLRLTLPSLAGMTRPVIDPTLTLQPDGTAGIDTYNQEGAADTANTTAVTLQINGVAASRRQAFVKFDLSSIPGGSTVTGATATFFCAAVVAQVRIEDLFPIKVANSGWVEGLTWNYANPSTVRWAGDTGADGGTDAGCSVSGTDYNAASSGNFTMGASDAVDTQYDAALIAADVQAMLTANYGWVIVNRDGFTTTKQLHSSDYATDTTKRPQLVVNYTTGGISKHSVHAGVGLGVYRGVL